MLNKNKGSRIFIPKYRKEVPMIHYTRESLDKMNRITRLNLVNCLSGYKSVNLIGTISPKGITNLAVFNSVIHLGSDPPLLGFILRPTTVPRHTYENLKASSLFTVNHVNLELLKRAHQTSASYSQDESEFELTGIEPLFRKNFDCPYVAESPIQIGCQYVNEYYIKENDTRLIVGEIKHIYLPVEALWKDGWLQLDKSGVLASNGLDGYATAQLHERLAYARPGLDAKRLTKENPS